MDNAKKICITELILNISELVTEINLQNKHDVFMEHYGHTKQIDVRVCLDGWARNKQYDFDESVYYDDTKYEKSLVKIIKLLEYVKCI